MHSAAHRRPNADVMEIDIAEVIASLEAEQTLVGRDLRRRATQRKRRSVVARVMRWLGA